VKTGLQVNIADLGLNVLFDLIQYSTAIDTAAIEKVSEKKAAAPMSVADMLRAGKVRG